MTQPFEHSDTKCIRETGIITIIVHFTNKYQKRYGDRQLRFKQYKYDVNGKKYILDVLDNKNKIIYDWKFGYPNKTPMQLNATPQLQKYRELWGFPSEVIKP